MGCRCACLVFVEQRRGIRDSYTVLHSAFCFPPVPALSPCPATTPPATPAACAHTQLRYSTCPALWRDVSRSARRLNPTLTICTLSRCWSPAYLWRRASCPVGCLCLQSPKREQPACTGTVTPLISFSPAPSDLSLGLISRFFPYNPYADPCIATVAFVYLPSVDRLAADNPGVNARPLDAVCVDDDIRRPDFQRCVFAQAADGKQREQPAIAVATFGDWFEHVPAPQSAAQASLFDKGVALVKRWLGRPHDSAANKGDTGSAGGTVATQDSTQDSDRTSTAATVPVSENTPASSTGSAIKVDAGEGTADATAAVSATPASTAAAAAIVGDATLLGVSHALTEAHATAPGLGPRGRASTSKVAADSALTAGTHVPASAPDNSSAGVIPANDGAAIVSIRWRSLIRPADTHHCPVECKTIEHHRHARLFNVVVLAPASELAELEVLALGDDASRGRPKKGGQSTTLLDRVLESCFQRLDIPRCLLSTITSDTSAETMLEVDVPAVLLATHLTFYGEVCSPLTSHLHCSSFQLTYHLLLLHRLPRSLHSLESRPQAASAVFTSACKAGYRSRSRGRPFQQRQEPPCAVYTPLDEPQALNSCRDVNGHARRRTTARKFDRVHPQHF